MIIARIRQWKIHQNQDMCINTRGKQWLQLLLIKAIPIEENERCHFECENSNNP